MHLFCKKLLLYEFCKRLLCQYIVMIFFVACVMVQDGLYHINLVVFCMKVWDFKGRELKSRWEIGHCVNKFVFHRTNGKPFIFFLFGALDKI